MCGEVRRKGEREGKRRKDRRKERESERGRRKKERKKYFIASLPCLYWFRKRNSRVSKGRVMLPPLSYGKKWQKNPTNTLNNLSQL